MATKTDFTPEQWEALSFAVTDTMLYVTIANGAHFWESMGETTAAAKYLIDQAKTSNSTFVRDLATDAGHHRDKTVKAGDMEPVTLDRVAFALSMVNQIAPDEAEAFKALVLGVACATAEAKDGVDEAETNAIDKVKSALL
jgi:hypothetical protein